MGRQIARQIVRRYINDLKSPTNEWFTEWFNEKSTKKWAAKEILYLITTDTTIGPITQVEKFYSKMLEYSDLGDIDDMFYIASKTSQEILDLLYAYDIEKVKY